ncbi:sugar transport protein [Pseudomassariella vexata]|uniref:Sugar transport protein n=1 Tax=Pseudomassariella vexata TaxID=1141098 RepID=A0A1Y2DSF5_9PEZI|nr:sugar transport protein [Pseudomassariella vexata]ORY62213.1 sugar transport protein [Pseudomassariella vexata]
MILSRIKGIPPWLSASVIAACSAMCFGLDTGTIGSVTSMSSFLDTFGELSATVHGVVVSSILLPGALSALFAGILADRWGRTRTITIGSVIFGLGASLEAASFWLPMFIVGRLIKGVGEGFFLSTAYVYVCEISPARIRGVMASVVQMVIVSGLVLGFFMCYGTERLPGSLSWRLPITVQAIVAFSNAACCSVIPPSPRWLQATGHAQQAREISAQLGLDEAEQAELFSQASIEPLEHSPDISFWQDLQHTARGFKETFSAPFRARTLFGIFLMAMQQFSGIDGVLYYAPILLRQAGIASQQASFLASGVSALVIMAVTIPATVLADKWGRKTSTVVGGSLIFVLMLLIGSLYASSQVHRDHGAGRWVVIVSIYLFAAVFSFTWAIGFRAYLIEMLPRKTRSSAASLAQSSNWVANYIVALTTPVFIATSSFGAYYFFAFSTLLCTVVCAVLMVETKGHSLEVIEKQYAERQSTSEGSWYLEKLGIKGSNMRMKVVRVGANEG